MPNKNRSASSIQVFALSAALCAFLAVLLVSIFSRLLAQPVVPSFEAQVTAVLNQIDQQESSVSECKVDRTWMLPSQRHAIIALCILESPDPTRINSRTVTFALHKTLWLSKLPIGYLLTHIMPPETRPSGGGSPVLSAETSYTAQGALDWKQSDVLSWVEWMQKNTTLPTGNREEGSFYNEYKP